MARLESKSSLLYYPTDLKLIEILASYFGVEEDVFTRAVDPCCGKGDALAELVNGFSPKPETFGIELGFRRAREAAQKLDRVIPASFYNVRSQQRWEVKSASLILDNPPYDWSDIQEKRKGEKKYTRHEIHFIGGSTTKLVPGGHHIIIVPRNILGGPTLLGSGKEDSVARHLVGWYEDVSVYHFPNDDWESYKQVVVLAFKKREKYQAPTKEAVEAITKYVTEDIPELPLGNGQYMLPEAPQEFRFSYMPIHRKDLLRLAREVSPIGGDEWRQALYVRPVGASYHPMMPEKLGHTTMSISGEQAGVPILQDKEDSRYFLMKGMSRKTFTDESVNKYDPNTGRYTSTKVTTKEKHVSHIALLYEDGETDLLIKGSDVAEFMTEYAVSIAERMAKKNTPKYNWDPSSEEWDILEPIAKGLPQLPGRDKVGLFNTQKHIAVANKRALFWPGGGGHVINNQEMGFGKTPTVEGVFYLIDAWPVIAMVPGHMVNKWRREMMLSQDKDKPVTARIINQPTQRTAPMLIPRREEDGTQVMQPVICHGTVVMDPYYERDEDGKKISEKKWKPRTTPVYDYILDRKTRWMVFKEKLQELGAIILETYKYQEDIAGVNDVGNRRYLKVEAKDHQTLVKIDKLLKGLKYRADTGEVNSNDKKIFKTLQPKIVSNKFIREIWYVDRDAYTMADFYEEYHSGRVSKRAIAIVGFDPAKYDAGFETVPATNDHYRKVAHPKSYQMYNKVCQHCPNCGEIVEVSGRSKDKKCEHCRGWLFSFSRHRRIGLAPLVKTRYKDFFKTYVFDEFHKGKARTTDIGAADQRFISSTKYSIAMTGTIFGGTASSLFYLLYRRNPEVRAEFTHDSKGETTWIDRYGLWQEDWSQRSEYVEGVGANTGIRRIHLRRRELPGISPAVIKYLLPITAFANITDLGYELPPLYEDVEMLDMTSIMAAQYKIIEKDILDAALKVARDSKDPGGLSRWFVDMRFRPASMFRSELSEYISKRGGGFSIPLPAVISNDDYWLPKEIRLAEIVRENTIDKTKTLVFVEQTGTRDIRDRLKKAIQSLAPGGNLMLVQVELLSASQMAPAKRESWIRKKTPYMDVMLVNPRLVETGLDLVMFSHLVFYETTISLYTLWQAMRRVWRLGQVNNVYVTFLGYKETMEEKIFQRIGQKMKYAQLLYGEDAAGTLIDTSTDDDIRRGIIRDALKGSVEESVLGQLEDITIFGTGKEKDARVTTAPMGSPIATSPIIIPTIPTAVTVPMIATVTSLPDGKEQGQILLFPGFNQVSPNKRKRKKKTPENQLGMFGK